METTFERMHQGEILDKLTTVDRLIIHGHLTRFWVHRALGGFLSRQGVHILSGFGRYVHQATERLKSHAENLARKAGRPFIYQDRVVKGKDDLAREIARKDGITQGLICVLSTLELASCFALCGGNIVPRLRKCLHLYFYVMDRELGFMHIRLQTWFPFQIQIYINGREWLARQLDKRGIGYERYENTFLRIDDMKTAQKLCQRFKRYQWPGIFDHFARRVNPLLPLIGRCGMGSYYWCIDACEVATDVMWRDRTTLRHILIDLFDHAVRTFSSDDVLRFLGQKKLPSKNEVATKYQRRPDCVRIKHRIRQNWIKMYDKWSVLRIETVINNPHDFRVLRFKADKRGRRRGRWMRMGKGVQNLWRYLQIGEAANHRYLEALSPVQPTGRAVGELDAVCRSRVVGGTRYPRLNPVAATDCQLFEAAMAGEHLVAGFRNKDLSARLYVAPPKTSTEATRRCARVSRLIRKLRGHGLVAKVPGSRLYRPTLRGQRVMSAAIRFRHHDFAIAAAAAVAA